MSTFDDDDREFLQALIKPLQDNDERYERAIFGNGQPGLISDVSGLKSWNKAAAGIVGLVLGFMLGPK